MSSTDYANIHTAVLSIWALNSEFSLPTQYENTDYTPIKGTPWARLTIIPVDFRMATMGGIGSGAEDEHTGFLNIELFYPPDQGWGDALAKLDAIRAAHSPTIYGDVGNATIYITATRRTGGRVEDGWYRVGLEVEFYARTTR